MSSSSKLHEVLNATISEIFSNLVKCFSDNITLQESQSEFETMRKSSETLPFEIWLQPDFSTNKLTSAIHKKNAEKFYARSTIFGKKLGGIQVYQQFDSDEAEALWRSLTSCSRWISLISGAGNSLSSFEDIAKSFISKQKATGGGESPKDMQKELFSSLFTDPEISNKLKQTFESPDSLKNILSSLGPLFEGLGVCQDSEEDDDDEEDKEEDEKPEDKKAEDDDIDEPPPLEDINDSTDMFQQPATASQLKKKSMKKNAAKKNKKKNNKKKKSPLADLLSLVKDVKLDDEDYEELHKKVTGSLGASDDSASTEEGGGFNLAGIFKAVSSGNPSDMMDAINDIKKSAKAEVHDERVKRRSKRDVTYAEMQELAKAAGQPVDSVQREADSEEDKDDEEDDAMTTRAIEALSSLTGSMDGQSPDINNISNILQNLSLPTHGVEARRTEMMKDMLQEHGEKIDGMIEEVE